MTLKVKKKHQGTYMHGSDLKITSKTVYFYMPFLAEIVIKNLLTKIL